MLPARWIFCTVKVSLSRGLLKQLDRRLVGKLGGIRSAALLGFDIEKEGFVATATAIALMVDAARMPVYFVSEARQLAQVWRYLVLGTIGVLVGTVLGQRMLVEVPEEVFRGIVSFHNPRTWNRSPGSSESHKVARS